MINAIIPASKLAFKAPAPNLAPTPSALMALSVNGKAPALILLASLVALSAVK